MITVAGRFNNIDDDYRQTKRVARDWARIALQNQRDGLPWRLAAQQAHAALRYALMIIA